MSFSDLEDKIKSYIDEENQLLIIQKAYEFALSKHDGQLRKSGEPFISHPLNVAFILVGIFADYETIAAALLHDVLLEEASSIEEIKEQFGENICKLVQGVWKLSKINFSTENEYLIDYYKKIIVGMSEDVRVIIIKLADCLHNMRTLWALPEDRQKVKAKEALDILVPIAHHLGIHKIKSELEDLSLRYLKPDVFYDIAEKLNKTKLEREKTVYDMQIEVSELLKEHHIIHEIKGRAKSIYSIYNKLNKGKKFSDIYDLLALRILVENEQDCYLTLGIIHSKFRPLPNRFKDYIAMPKPNMYQSLHTTVFGTDGYLFEIQIRTYDMDEVAENGIASHWAYKEKENSRAMFQNTTDQKLQFFKSILDLSSDKVNTEELIDEFQNELLNNSIYVFTPKGDVIELPKGATPVDFAYKIHSRVGDTTVGAIVNNNIVPLDYQLKDNDIVKINTNKNSTPSKEWMNFVKTSQAKSQIKSFFVKSEKEIYIEGGKYSLEKELRRRKISFSDFFTDENIKSICEVLKVDGLDNIYAAVGNNRYTAGFVVNIIDKQPEPTPKIVKANVDTDADIIVGGFDKIKVNLANCCNPVCGDEIIGYITKNNGISVHRSTCHNLTLSEDRTLDVEWNINTNKRYLTYVLVYTNTSSNHMFDLMQTISIHNISVDGINIINRADNCVYEIGCYVKNVDQLQKLMVSIAKGDYVDKIEREMR